MLMHQTTDCIESIIHFSTYGKRRDICRKRGASYETGDRNVEKLNAVVNIIATRTTVRGKHQINRLKFIYMKFEVDIILLQFCLTQSLFASLS